MTKIKVGIIFGGDSSEHNESIRAARILHRDALSKLEGKYSFRYFYLTKTHEWASRSDSERMIHKEQISQFKPDPHRLNDLQRVDVIYSTMM